MSRAPITLLLALAAACAAEDVRVAEPPAGPDWDALAPAEALALVEAGLVDDPNVRADFEVRAEGALAVDLGGALAFGPGGHVRLTAAGAFAGRDIDVAVEQAAGRMTGRGGLGAFDDEAPAALREAVAVGLVRMGVLHNVAMLAAGGRPDAADGSVRTWVDARAVARVPSGDDGVLALQFEIFVRGLEAGEATLRVDRATGRPLGREQVVRFSEGEMRVTERYAFR